MSRCHNSNTVFTLLCAVSVLFWRFLKTRLSETLLYCCIIYCVQGQSVLWWKQLNIKFFSNCHNSLSGNTNLAFLYCFTNTVTKIYNSLNRQHTAVVYSFYISTCGFIHLHKNTYRPVKCCALFGNNSILPLAVIAFQLSSLYCS